MAEHASAGHPYNRRGRDFPDPLSWRDVLSRPDQFGILAAQRLHEGKSPGLVEVVPIPKPSGKSRPFVCLDAIDAIVYRDLVGGVMPSIKSMTGSEVSSFSLSRMNPWVLEPHPRRAADRRSQGLAHLGRPSTVAMGTMDISNFYVKLPPRALAGLLVGGSASSSHVVALSDWLKRQRSNGGTTGIPIGPEGSVPLGNVGLVAGDHALRSAGVEFVRWTDDTWVFLDDRRWWPVLQDAYENAVAGYGRLNADKSELIEDLDVAREVVSSSELQYLVGLSESSKTTAFIDANRDRLEKAVYGSGPFDQSLLRYAVRVLASNGRPEGLAVFCDRPDLVAYDPRLWGDYLSKMFIAGQVSPDERDMFSAIALSESSELGVRIHVMRALANVQLEDAEADAFLDVASNLRHGGYLRSFALLVWSQSKAWERDMAVDLAMEASHSTFQRVAVASLRRAGTKHADRAVDRVCSTNPELRPTGEWALAA